MTTTAYAEDFDFFTEKIPGSYIMEYGGPYEIMVKQTSKLLEATWLERQELHYHHGYMTYTELEKKQTDIKLTIAEWKNGLPWYYRNWWHSRPEEKGGAPKHPMIIRKGKTLVLADFGLFYVTTAGEVKWRGLEMSIDFDKKSTITLGIGSHVSKPRSGWKFKAYPGVKVSVSRLISRPLKAVRRVDINLGGVYSIRGKDILAVMFNTWYNFKEHGWFFGVQLKLVQW
jgi:hypothetical protein